MHVKLYSGCASVAGAGAAAAAVARQVLGLAARALLSMTQIATIIVSLLLV